MNPLWVIAAVIAITAIGTKAFQRGAAMLMVVAGVSVATLALVAAVAWVWNGGSHGWCEPRSVAVTLPKNRVLTLDEFTEVLNRHRVQNLSAEQINALADLESQRTPGCWHSWRDE